MLKKTDARKGLVSGLIGTTPRMLIFSALTGIIITVIAISILAWMGFIEIDLNALRSDSVRNKVEAISPTDQITETAEVTEETEVPVQKTDPADKIVETSHLSDDAYDGSLFVEDRLKDAAFIPTDKKGQRLYGTIGFRISDKDVKLTAPADGYVDVYFNLPGQKDPVVVFTDHEGWYFDKEGKIHVIGFYASDWKKINKGPIKKGGEIGIATADKDLFTDTFSEKANFSFSAVRWWRESSDKTSDDPSEYMTELMKSFGTASEEL